MVGKTSIEDDVPTACTDGRNTKYGRKFIEGMPEPEVRAVVLHENLHKAFRHIEMWKHLYKENPQLANMACDYVINLMIHDTDPNKLDVKLPDSGLLDEKYRGLDAGTVYRDLKKQADENKSIKVKTADNKERDVPVKSLEEALKDALDKHDWDNGESMSTEEKEQLARDIDQALRQGQILAGKMGGNIPREVADALTAKVDWREALREFVTSFCAERDESTWRRPSRRWIGEDVYMPSLIGESVGRLVIAIDMSGSIGVNEVGQFLGEVKLICERVKPEGIDLLYWDTDVCQHEKYDRDQLDNLLASTKPAGGGGTDPSCIPKYIAEHKLKPECAIILTDGYVCDWGEWDCPTLWGITTPNIVAPIGKSVQVY
jgi:predicted metal-dependent peptidase